MTRAARLAAALLLALALAGCSVARVAYTNAPPAIAWMVDDWFDLQDGQRDWVKERAARLIAWHRVSELPEYERFLQEIAVRQAEALPMGQPINLREQYATWVPLLAITALTDLPEAARFRDWYRTIVAGGSSSIANPGAREAAFQAREEVRLFLEPIIEQRRRAPGKDLLSDLVTAEYADVSAAATVQIMGGMGFTFEHDAHLYCKRAFVLGQLLGGPSTQLGLLLDQPASR